MLLSIAYLPPISYFALMAKEFTLSPDGVIPSTVFLEACESYRKQSWRNRFTFLAADGPQSLNFPIVHEPGVHNLPITRVRVDYSVPWVLKTERAIESAYESSAFFDYYKDEFFAILDSKPVTLFDLDLQLIRFFLRKTGISANLRLTSEYSPALSCSEPVESELYGTDYREVLHPKRPDTVLRSLGLEKPYFQVFSRKHGFVPNLSIIDLLFNEGPDSIVYLKKL